MIGTKYDNLKKEIENLGSLCVAFSGGVDSTLLLYVAHQVLGDKAMGVTVKASMHSDREMTEAEDFVKSIGVKHLFVDANEYNIPEFVENGKERCYYCKKAIFTKIEDIAKSNNIKYVADGSISDDDDDYRPGMRALKELEVISPLKLAGFSKKDVRALSKELDLPTWDKPSMACLASRIPYGVEITKEKLKQVELAEDFLLEKGFTQFRVRHHGDVARIEISPNEEEKFFDRKIREGVINHFKSIGFIFITFDLEGYRVGSMNEVLTSEEMKSGSES